MSPILRTFYAFLLAWTRIDIQIARSTGRNPAHILRLRHYERAICRLDLRI